RIDLSEEAPHTPLKTALDGFLVWAELNPVEQRFDRLSSFCPSILLQELVDLLKLLNVELSERDGRPFGWSLGNKDLGHLGQQLVKAVAKFRGDRKRSSPWSLGDHLSLSLPGPGGRQVGF